MDGLQGIGRFLLVVGFMVAALGALLMLAGKVPWLGRLPGDILVKKRHFTFYFPLATSLLISVVLSLLLWFLGRR
jgi:hypothetical protein